MNTGEPCLQLDIGNSSANTARITAPPMARANWKKSVTTTPHSPESPA